MAKACFESGYLCVKRVQKGPSLEGKQLRKIEVICAITANYSFYFLFLGHPVLLQHTLNMFTYISGSKGSKKAKA